MTVVPFDWMPIATPGAGKGGAVVADEGNVGRAAHTDEARRGARVSHSLDQSLEHVLMCQAPDRHPQSVGERRAECDHDVVRFVAYDGNVLLDNHGLLRVRRLVKRARVELVRKMLQTLPALAVQAIAGAGPRVAVRIVDCRADRRRSSR